MSRGRKYFDDDENANDYQHIEKIKKGVRSVRGRVTDDWFVKTMPKHMRLGRVIEAQKKNIFIAEENENGLCQTDKIWLCTIAKRHFQRAHHERNFVVVGDRVAFEPNSDITFDKTGEPLDTNLPRGVIQHALPRKNQISRRDPLQSEWEHVLFANIDLLLIVASVLKPTVRFGLIDRLLVRAELEHIPAIIILNKVDLLKKLKVPSRGERYRQAMPDGEDTLGVTLRHKAEALSLPDGTAGSTKKTKKFLDLYKNYCTVYKKLGYEVFEISTLYPRTTATALKRLREILKGKMIGFIGHSGVGKSSLVNLMKPEFEQIVDEDSDIFYKGRHTTTYNSLLQLGIGAYAIDSPGVRAFDVKSYNPQTLSACFPEFKPYTCKYRSCTHNQESDCGIKEAVARKEIFIERYKSYLGMIE